MSKLVRAALIIPTLAIAGKEIFLRTYEHLYCIEER